MTSPARAATARSIRAKSRTRGGPWRSVCATQYGIENFAESPSLTSSRWAACRASGWTCTSTGPRSEARPSARACVAASIGECVPRQLGWSLIQLRRIAGLAGDRRRPARPHHHLEPERPVDRAPVDAGARRAPAAPPAPRPRSRARPGSPFRPTRTRRGCRPRGAPPSRARSRAGRSVSSSSLDAATAAPTGAHTVVGCQPASYSAGWLAAASAAIASKPSA